MKDHLNEIIKPLLDWYDKNARVLPWREEPTPYRVWISEIMLQQTRVEAVKPYFDRFITALPDVESLANAGEEELLKLWEGLGYYNRVRNLQTAAKEMMDQYNGTLPSSYEALLSLKGIGPYTAGAIASIAFGVAMPAVDGNVLRVISRILASKEDVGQERVKREMSEKLKEILPKGRVGDFNQALMELGATVCLPHGAPKCSHCPVLIFCKAYEEDLVMELPQKARKKPRKIQEKTLFILIENKRVGMKKRPSKGILAGLWEFPSVEGILTKKEIENVIFDYGIKKENMISLESLDRSKHIFTHIEWFMAAYLIVIDEPFENDLTWINREELEKNFSVPSAFKVYTEKLKDIL